MRALAFIVLCLGCGSGAIMPPPVGDFMVELGTSALDGSGYYALTGDQPLVAGAQGGFHVWVKWKVEGMAPQKVHVARKVQRTRDGALILTTMQAIEVGSASGDGWWMLPAAQPSFMCPTPVGISVENEQVKFDLSLFADKSGEPGALLGSTTATATPRCPMDAQQQFCQSICNG